MNSSPITASLPQLNPALRWIVLVGWVLVVLAHLFIFVVDLVFDYSQMLVPCAGPDCNFLAISDAEVAVLAAWGLTTRAYALVMILLPVVALLVYWALAGLILWRQGTSRFGLAVSLALIVIPITTYASDHDWSTSNPNLAFFGYVVGILGGVITLVFFYLIPNGRFSPRWAYIPLICTLLPLTVLNLAENGLYTLPTQVSTLGNIVVVGLVLLCGGLQIYRYVRDSSALERQQTKLILIGILSYILAIIVWILIFGGALDIPAGTTRLVANIVGWYSGLLTILALPAALTIAIMRYRLWDIDFVINRSLVYGALTALLVALFGGTLLIISSLFQNFSGGPFVSLTLSAAVFGIVFHPARRRLQRFVDQRFYHIYIDYQKTPSPDLQSSGMTQVLRQTDFGTYKNLVLIGRGGMAEVYKSTHPTLGTAVAIKVLPAALANQADFRQRFSREAQVVSKLEHPNIVRVFDYGQQDDLQYMVMEYVDGQDLNAYLRANGKLTLAHSLPLIQQIADALDYAHTQGLVHRDIKPSNILLDTNSQTRVVLTDFGIAKIVDARTAMTGTGGVLGTFDYIAPEQIEASPTVDGRADVYALGVMVYQMLTGELPFKHNNPGALLMAHMTQPPPDPRRLTPDLSSDLANAIQQAMAKDPARRFATAGAFVARLG